MSSMRQLMDVSPLAGHATLHFPFHTFVTRAVQSMRSGCGLRKGNPKSCEFCVTHPQSATLIPLVNLGGYCAVYRNRNSWSMLSVSLIHTWAQSTGARNPCCLRACAPQSLYTETCVKSSEIHLETGGRLVMWSLMGWFIWLIPCDSPCPFQGQPRAMWWQSSDIRMVTSVWLFVWVLGRGIYKYMYACIDMRIVNYFRPGFWHLHSIPTLHVHSQRRFKDWFLLNCSMALMPPPSTVAAVLFFVSFLSHGVCGQPDSSQCKPVSSPDLPPVLVKENIAKDVLWRVYLAWRSLFVGVQLVIPALSCCFIL